MDHSEPKHWVFAYGSLMWDPGFAVSERVVARLDGYSRSFCMTSVVYRGTTARPGLVLALDQDGKASCMGLALGIDAAIWAPTIAGLRARELTTMAYYEAELPITLADGRAVRAVTYVMRREHPQYIGQLPLHQQARMIATAEGERGPNRDYLFNTTHHLIQMGIRDPLLEVLSDQVRGLVPPPGGSGG